MPAKIAVPLMCAVIVIATVVAVAVVLGGHRRAVLIAFGFVAALMLWAVVLTIPAIVRSRR